jgi:hypothetical protein
MASSLTYAAMNTELIDSAFNKSAYITFLTYASAVRILACVVRHVEYLEVSACGDDTLPAPKGKGFYLERSCGSEPHAHYLVPQQDENDG